MTTSSGTSPFFESLYKSNPVFFEFRIERENKFTSYFIVVPKRGESLPTHDPCYFFSRHGDEEHIYGPIPSYDLIHHFSDLRPFRCYLGEKEISLKELMDKLRYFRYISERSIADGGLGIFRVVHLNFRMLTSLLIQKVCLLLKRI